MKCDKYDKCTKTDCGMCDEMTQEEIGRRCADYNKQSRGDSVLATYEALSTLRRINND